MLRTWYSSSGVGSRVALRCLALGGLDLAFLLAGIGNLLTEWARLPVGFRDGTRTRITDRRPSALVIVLGIWEGCDSRAFGTELATLWQGSCQLSTRVDWSALPSPGGLWEVTCSGASLGCGPSKQVSGCGFASVCFRVEAVLGAGISGFAHGAGQSISLFASPAPAPVGLLTCLFAGGKWCWQKNGNGKGCGLQGR